MSSQEKDTIPICDQCGNLFSFLIVAWGRELTPEEKRCNDILKAEGKAEKCEAYGRYFNKNFKKRKSHCEQGIEL